MDLDRLQIRLRRRTTWEAIDLGFAMARRWFMPLWLLWLSTAVPVALISFLLFNDTLWLVGLCLWWFKPLFEPTLMFWLSRAVFSETLSVKLVMKQWWRITRPQILINLTLRRFNPGRSFTMPVALLEQLKGKPRRQRVQVLGRNQHASAWLTVVGIHLETILQMAFITLLFFLIPEDLRWISLEDMFMGDGQIGEWLQLAGGVLCMSLIAPFYVSAGFALYLHRRSELEGWDLEIAFRQMNERYQQQTESRRSVGSVVSALILSLTLALVTNISLLPAPAYAAGMEAEQTRDTIEAVLADEAFGRYEQEGYWKYIGEEEKQEQTDNSWMPDILKTLFRIIRGFLEGYASVGKILMWGLGIAIVVFLLYRISQSQGWFDGFAAGRKSRRREQPVELFGLDLRPESLPDDPAAEALTLIEAGQLRAALSLLYRAALLTLINRHHIEIPRSATEGECVGLVERYRSTDEAAFFARLTGLWLRLAYGHQEPASADLITLCQQWQGVYGRVTD